MLAGNKNKTIVERDSNSTQFVFGCAATVWETSSNPPILLSILLPNTPQSKVEIEIVIKAGWGNSWTSSCCDHTQLCTGLIIFTGMLFWYVLVYNMRVFLAWKKELKIIQSILAPFVWPSILRVLRKRWDMYSWEGSLKIWALERWRLTVLDQLKLKLDGWILTEMINTGSDVFQAICHDVFEEIMILSKVECERINVLEYFMADLALVLRIPVFLQELLLDVDGNEVKVKRVLVLGSWWFCHTRDNCARWLWSASESEQLVFLNRGNCLHRSGSDSPWSKGSACKLKEQDK